VSECSKPENVAIWERFALGLLIKSKLLHPFKSVKKSEVQNSKNTTVALKELTMRVPKGSSLGVIGRNGSGKSTLLKLITGIYKPDTGRVSVNGRLAALIELGAGFHPDFTGKENVYLAGAMYGLSKKEVTSKLKAIVDFAELSAVMDQPVRTYSSGMFMRLGFSVAIHIEPEVLLIDEVLAVGDEGFISKCKQKITDLRKTGKTLLLVSHDLAAVERWCDEVIWLHEGVVKDRGDPRRVIDHYRHFIEKGEEKQIIDVEDQAKNNSSNLEEVEINKDINKDSKKEAKRWGSREIEITSARLIDSKGESHRVFRTATSVKLEINYKFNEKISDEIVFGIGIDRSCGTQIYGSNTSLDRFKVKGLKSSGSIIFEIESLDLLEGVYFIDVAVHKEDGYPFDYHKAILEFHVKNPDNQIGVWKPKGSWKVL
jgi:ABC-type polysaccharide/polyol phosphate transport system ATPase subunit